jgi:hypothetical protein
MPPIWPFLLLACALCSFWNWRAALAFASCVIIVRALLHFELNNLQLWFMMLYSVTAFAVLFFVDKVAGGFLAIIGALFCLSLLGIVEPRAKMILSEVAIVAGLLASGLAGPSGGLFSPSGVYRAVSGPVHDSGLAGRSRIQAGSKGD